MILITIKIKWYMAFANKILLVLIGILLLNSCSRNNSEPEEVFRDTSTLLRIKNNRGENFLETVNTDNIQLYYKKNGVLTLLTYSSPGAILDYPKGYLIIKEPPVNEKMIRILCYNEGNNPSEETYIKWNDSDMDTLSYKVTRYETGSISIHSIKYNNKPISNNNEYGIYDFIKP